MSRYPRYRIEVRAQHLRADTHLTWCPMPLIELSLYEAKRRVDEHAARGQSARALDESNRDALAYLKMAA